MPIITPIRAFKDNYIWMFAKTQQAWVVDPGDATPVIKTLQQQQLTLAGILITHHHQDHSGGVEELIQHWKNVVVIASHASRISHITQRVAEGDRLDCGAFELNVLEIPGHTLDHLAFYNQDSLFCGDTLFSAGCGRVFEGTPAQMYQSLSKLAQLADHTQVYCGHEYTLANLHFAARVEPTNTDIIAKIQSVEDLRANDIPTLPSTLHEEKKINPFLRCETAHVIAATEKYANKKLMTPTDVFTHLREWKNKG